MAQNGKLMPNLDQQSTKVLNLTVLQRIDPAVEEILMTAAHSRKDVEGSLFVVKRNAQPRFQFIVMNRRNTDNLVEDLLGDFEFEVQLPYLLYRNAAQEVNGIWFYNSQDCEAVATLFSRILHAYSKVPPKPKVSSTKSEFEELEAVPSLSVIEGPLEPPSSSAATSIPEVTDDSFVNFFSAMNVSATSNVTVPGQTPVAPATIPLTSSHVPNNFPPALPTVQSIPTLPTSTLLVVPSLESHEASTGNSNRATNLVKPSFFSPAPSSSTLVMPPLSSSSTAPTVPPLHPPVTMQRPYGTPMLQPFPPPTPPPSLTPAPNSPPVITREKVRDALMRLVQNNDFIDMVYREMMNAHYS